MTLYRNIDVLSTENMEHFHMPGADFGLSDLHFSGVRIRRKGEKAHRIAISHCYKALTEVYCNV